MAAILGAQSSFSAICTHIGATPDLTKTHTPPAITLHDRFLPSSCPKGFLPLFCFLVSCLEIGLLLAMGARTAKLWDLAFCLLACVPLAHLFLGSVGYVAAHCATFVQPLL
jgi:hypothetical protein